MKKLVVIPALLKAHVDTYTRKDGTVVQAHDDKRQAAAPDPHAHKVAAGWTKDHEDSVAVHVPPKGAKVTHPSIQGAGTVHSVAGNTVTVSHVKTVNGKKYPRLEDFHASKLSPHPGSGGAKPAAAKPTGSAAPAKKVNVGSEKWPLHAKASEKLGAKHHDGSTHHVGGFEAPSDGKGDHLIHHDGRAFSFTGKKGKNMKTGEDSFEYSHHDEREGVERRAWVTRSGHLQND